MDSNKKLKTALKNFSLRQSEVGERECLSELPQLFRKEESDLSLKELDMLLLLRQKADQILLCEEDGKMPLKQIVWNFISKKYPCK